jgi:predicted MFS family arabinose efflux permease
VTSSKWLVPVLVCIGFVVAIDGSLGSPMVPTAALEFGVSEGDAQWLLTVAFLSGAVTTPILSRLGDGPYGREAVLWALGAVAVGGLCAAVAPGFGVFLIGRALQGVGMGLVPLTMGIAGANVEPRLAASAIATLSVTTVAGSGVGYPLSALAVESLGFQATFGIAAVIAGAVGVAAAVVVPSSRHLPQRSVNVLGAGLMAVAFSTFVIGVSGVSEWGVASSQFITLMAVSLSVTVVWVANQRHAVVPIVDLRTFRSPSVRVAQTAALLAGVGFYFLIVIVVRYVQTPTTTGYGPGESVLTASMLLVPLCVVSLAVGRLMPSGQTARAAAPLRAFGCLLFAVAMMVFVIARTELWHFIVVMSLAGVGVGVMLAWLPVLIVDSVAERDRSSTLGFQQILIYVGSALGSAASASVLASRTPAGAAFPTDDAYTLAAFVGILIWIATAVVVGRRDAPVAGDP